MSTRPAPATAAPDGPQSQPLEHPMRSVLTFESMITPKIIGAMLSVGRLSYTSFATGLLIIAGGALAARIWCELLIVLFKINEHMQTVSNRL